YSRISLLESAGSRRELPAPGSAACHRRAGACELELGFVAWQRSGAAVRPGYLSSGQMAGLAGLRHRVVGRYRLSHLRSGVERIGSPSALERLCRRPGFVARITATAWGYLAPGRSHYLDFSGQRTHRRRRANPGVVRWRVLSTG